MMVQFVFWGKPWERTTQNYRHKTKEQKRKTVTTVGAPEKKQDISKKKKEGPGGQH